MGPSWPEQPQGERGLGAKRRRYLLFMLLGGLALAALPVAVVLEASELSLGICGAVTALGLVTVLVSLLLFLDPRGTPPPRAPHDEQLAQERHFDDVWGRK